YHPSAVAGARMSGRAREPSASVAAGRQNDLMGAKPMQRALGHVKRNDAAAFAVFHNEIEREVFDEKTRIVLQRLLIQGMQHRMPRAIGRRAGTLRDALAEMRGHAAERALVNQ